MAILNPARDESVNIVFSPTFPHPRNMVRVLRARRLAPSLKCALGVFFRANKAVAGDRVIDPVIVLQPGNQNQEETPVEPPPGPYQPPMTIQTASYVVNVQDNEDIPPPKPDYMAPPPYEVATKLPTYEEVQREKTLQGEPTQTTQPMNRPMNAGQPLPLFAIDADGQDADVDTGLLGTDFMFFTAFFGMLFVTYYLMIS